MCLATHFFVGKSEGDLKIYKKITSWFLADLLAETEDYYERGKIKLLCNLVLAIVVCIIPICIGLLFLEAVPDFISSITVLFSLMMVPLVLKYRRSFKLASILFITVVYCGIASTFAFGLTFGLINIAWYSLLVMYASFTMGRKWAAVVMILCIVPYVYYVYFLMHDNLHNEALYEGGRMAILALIGGISLLLGYFLAHRFILSKDLAQNQLKKINIELEERNQLISQQKAEKELMLKEIHHRVKNNMQIINSLLRLQSKDITDDETLKHFQEAQNRIFSMALIHEKMYRADDLVNINLSEYFISLIKDLIRTYSIDVDISTDVQIEAETMGPKALVPLGLLVNEIVTNSIEHAFVGRDSGKITMRVEPENGGFKLMISDDGIGMTEEDEDSVNLGTELIQTFVDQLEGSIERLSQEGTGYEIRFIPEEEEEAVTVQ